MRDDDLDGDYGESPAKRALRDLRNAIDAAVLERDKDHTAREQASWMRGRMDVIRGKEREREFEIARLKMLQYEAIARLKMLQYEAMKARRQRDQEIASMGGLTRGAPLGGGQLGGGTISVTNPYVVGNVGNIASTTTVIPKYTYSIPSVDQITQWGPGDVLRVRALPPRIKGDVEGATPYDFESVEVMFPHEDKTVFKVSLPPQSDTDIALMRKVMEHKGDHGCDQRVVWRPCGYPAGTPDYFRLW